MCSYPYIVAFLLEIKLLLLLLTQNWVNFYFDVKFDLEGQDQLPPKTIGILTKVFYTYGPNSVILA